MKTKAFPLFRSLAVSSIAALSLCSAHAATYNWTGSITGGSNQTWVSGFGATPGVAGDTFNLVAHWSGATTIDPTAPSVTLGILNLEDLSSPTSITLNSNSSLFIMDNGGSDAQINVTGMGSGTTITTAVQLKSNLAVNNATTLILNGTITGYGNFTKTGAGNLTLGSSSNSFIGSTTISQGSIILPTFSNASKLPTNTDLTIASGASMTGAQAAQTVASLAGGGNITGSVTNGQGFNLTVSGATSTTYSGNMSLGRNTSVFTKDGVSTLTLTGANDFTRAQLNNGKVVLDYNTVTTGNRFHDTSALVLNGGELALLGQTDTATTETLAGLTTGFTQSMSGQSTPNAGIITLTPSGTTGSATFQFSALTRVANYGVLFRGTNLGSSAGTFSQIKFTAAPTLLGGDYTTFTNTPGVGVIANAFGDTSATGLGTGLVTYDASGVGVRLLNGSEFIDYATAGTAENATLIADSTLTGKVVNSLSINNSTAALLTTTLDNSTLTLTSGALVFSGDANNPITLTKGAGTGGLTAAARQSYNVLVSAGTVATIDATTNLNFTGGLSDQLGLFKYGAGTLILKQNVSTTTALGANSAGAVISVNAGTLQAGAANLVGFQSPGQGNNGGTGLFVANGATFDLAGFNQTFVDRVRIDAQAGSIITNTSATNVILTPVGGGQNRSGTVNLAGTITDGNGVAAGGLISLNYSQSAGANGDLIVAHGGNALQNLTVANTNNANTVTATFNSLSDTDDNTINGNVTIGGGSGTAASVLTANTRGNGVIQSKTLGTAPITMNNGARLNINSRGITAASTNTTYTWTNDVTANANSTLTVGSGDSGLSTGVIQQLDELNLVGLNRQLTATANNNYTLEFTGATTLNHGADTTQTFNVTAGTLALNAVGESGGGAISLAKSGAGTLLIKGAGNYSGVTTINAGTLKLGAAATLASPPTVSVASGATFDVTAPANPFSIAALSGTGTVAGSASVAGTVAPGDALFSGPLTVSGNLATPGTLDIDFDTVGAAQVETATASGTVDNTGGNVNVTVTGVGIVGSPLVIPVTLTALDPATTWAQSVRDALSGTAAITALYTVGGSGALITLTANTSVANDSTLNIALANGTPTPTITAAATSANTTTGYVPGIDSVVVGGALTLTGSTLDVAGVGTLAAPAYVIAKYDTLVGTFASTGTLPPGYTLDYAYNNGINTKNIALVQTGGADPFDTWATTTHGLSGGNAEPDADPDQDGLDNAIEFVVGGLPNPATAGSMSAALAPTLTTDATNLIFTYRRSDLSVTQPGISTLVQYGSNLTGWTTATHGVSGVTVVSTNDFYGSSPGVDRVVVTIPKALAGSESKLFARLRVIIP